MSSCPDFGIGDVLTEPVYSSAEVQPNPNEKLVKALDAATEAEALVVKGLLESAGIDSSLATAEDMDHMVHMVQGFGGMVLLVREEDAEKARRLIAEQRRTSPADDDETAEIEITEEPPQKP
jgi:hypothetical protein